MAQRSHAAAELVTAIEILSPVNKRPGHEAHKSCLRKRRELLRSEANLMEIDLLRGGERPRLMSNRETLYRPCLRRSEAAPKRAFCNATIL